MRQLRIWARLKPEKWQYLKQDHQNAATALLSSYLGWDDALHTALQIAFKDVGLGQLLVPVGRQPDLGQRPTFAEDKVGVEHCPGSPDSHTHTVVCFTWKIQFISLCTLEKPFVKHQNKEVKTIERHKLAVQDHLFELFWPFVIKGQRTNLFYRSKFLFPLAHIINT